MSGMKKRIWGIVWLSVFILAGASANASRAAAQGASIEFVVRATPSDGLEEPVRGFPFFLLSKSFAEIGKEADAGYPKPDMDAFIAKQDVSKELRAWMKKNDWVALSGEDFIHKLHADDILNVPEFKTAYMDRNSGDQSADFPQPKFKASDQVKNPAKFDKLSADYVEAIRHYIEAHPESIDGIDLGLDKIDPSPKWNSILPFISAHSTSRNPITWWRARKRIFRGRDFCEVSRREHTGSVRSMSRPQSATHGRDGICPSCCEPAKRST